MNAEDAVMKQESTLRARPRRFIRRFCRSDDGATAIEFAMLAMPYFLVVFAIIETFTAFMAEQLVSNAVDDMARRLRTGEITYNLNRPTDMTQSQFRSAFCDRISILITCSAAERTAPQKLYIEARSFTDFATIPDVISRGSGSSAFSPASFQFSPGGAGTINVLRAYYRWEVMTDLIRPFLATVKPDGGGMPRDFLIVATSAFQNEAYP